MLPEDFGAGDGDDNNDEDDGADGMAVMMMMMMMLVRVVIVKFMCFSLTKNKDFDSLAVGLSGKEPINKADGPFCNLIQKPVSSPHVKKIIDQVMVFLIQRIAHCTVTI